jgi:hypothetical protein
LGQIRSIRPRRPTMILSPRTQRSSVEAISQSGARV